MTLALAQRRFRERAIADQAAEKERIEQMVQNAVRLALAAAADKSTEEQSKAMNDGSEAMKDGQEQSEAMKDGHEQSEAMIDGQVEAMSDGHSDEEPVPKPSDSGASSSVAVLNGDEDTPRTDPSKSGGASGELH